MHRECSSELVDLMRRFDRVCHCGETVPFSHVHQLTSDDAVLVAGHLLAHDNLFRLHFRHRGLYWLACDLHLLNQLIQLPDKACSLAPVPTSSPAGSPAAARAAPAALAARATCAALATAT